MAMTRGEQYSTFLLLRSGRSTLRQTLEGTRNSDGSVNNLPGPAPDPATLLARATNAFVALGVNPANLVPPVNLALLHDANGTNNVTTDEPTIANALAMDDYGGNCPDVAAQALLFQGITQQMP
jgi:hypothetical protein